MSGSEMIGGNTCLCGVMGDPIAHTLSPAIHNYLAKTLGVDSVYVPFHVKKEDLKDALRGAHGLGIKGMNVTVPHKQAVMDYLEYLDRDAAEIGAVNTLVKGETGYRGYNTDWRGLGQALAWEGVSLTGAHVVILGAGGAANAVAYLCGYEGASHVTILNRTLQKARILAERMAEKFPDTVFSSDGILGWKKLTGTGYLCIQTTSWGMRPNEGKAVIEDEEFYQKLAVAADIVFSPLETKYMKLAAAAGVKTFNGLNMLLLQAVWAFELMHGVKVTEEIITGARAYLKEILKDEA